MTAALVYVDWYPQNADAVFTSLDCGTLFVMGEDDHNAPGRPNAPQALRPKMGQNAELAKALAAKMPSAKAEVIPNTGHLVFLEARQKFDELMLAFLASH